MPTSYYLGLSPYLSATGLAYEVVPFAEPQFNPTAQKAFRNVVNDYRWGGLDAPDARNLYLDETVRRMVSSVRSGVYTIVENLMMMDADKKYRSCLQPPKDIAHAADSFCTIIIFGGEI